MGALDWSDIAIPLRISINVRSAKNLDHLLTQAVADLRPRFWRDLIDIGVEQVILQIHLLDQHLGVENIRLMYINVNGIVLVQDRLVDIILYRGDPVIHKKLFPPRSS